MSALDLCDGDVVRLTSLKNNFVCPKGKGGKEVGLLSASFTAPKGKVFVAVLLGVESKDGSNPIDLDAAMGRLGWVRKEDAE